MTVARYELFCHPQTDCSDSLHLDVELERLSQGGLRLCYRVRGDLAQLNIPAPQRPAETQDLWRHTCFELFVAVANQPAYLEFNFSPSGQWAVFAFSAYRQRRSWKAQAIPVITLTRHEKQLCLEVTVTVASLPSNPCRQPLTVGLSAVIENVDGFCSYWALHHPGRQADFHQRTGFTALLEP